ncbi:RNA polymerase sigma factor [Arenicella chitinivorans]|uniref:RNA polymerase sigma factor n=1 Tax=Arenicella chitinivorans TaxID=1329800 RepID=A0A918RPM2_9GAMM|nr:sigma-70 family RNA polymerase sigma factor [Arenicella chitinivorans]GHA03707.1 RNA polymerase sigma factor [Arenicella chitinivorans]
MLRWTTKLMRDEALMRRFADGDMRAFEALYARHKHALYQFVRRQCDIDAECEEVVQDTWLAVVRTASTYQVSAKFRTWLFRIAHNRLVDYWRSHGYSKRQLMIELDETVHSAQTGSTPGDVSSPLVLTQLLTKLSELPEEQTETLLLRAAGFSYAEIATITDSKQETVKSRLRYATQRMRVTAGVTS